MRILVILVLLSSLGCSEKSKKEVPDKVQNSGPQYLPDGKALDPDQDANRQFFPTSDGRFEIGFPEGWYESKKEHPYDLQCKSKDDNLNTGEFSYSKIDLAEFVTPRDIFNHHIEDLKSLRKNFKVAFDEQVVRGAGKTLSTIVYAGEKDLAKFYYRYSLVEFDRHPELFMVVLQVTAPSHWAEAVPAFDGILKSIRVNVERAPKQ